MLFVGIIILKHELPGSKSEGVFAYLQAEEEKMYRLYRPEVYPINDSFFYPFENEWVEVEGELERENFIAIEWIRKMKTEEEPIMPEIEDEDL